MINVVDRVPTLPGRIKLTDEQTGTEKYYILERADEPVENGTPINRLLFNMLQNDIYNVINQKATFLLGEVIATEDCQELTITGLNIPTNSVILVTFNGNANVTPMSYKINNGDRKTIGDLTNVFSFFSYANGRVSVVSIRDNNSSSNPSFFNVAISENINSITIINGYATQTSIRAGDRFAIYKLTY